MKKNETIIKHDNSNKNTIKNSKQKIKLTEYDGYYNTKLPDDAGVHKNIVDKKQIKMILLILGIGAVFVTVCVWFLMN